MLALALMICLLPYDVSQAQAPGCTVLLKQDTAMVGQPVYAIVQVPEGVTEDSLSCVWLYKRGPSGRRSLPCWRSGRCSSRPNTRAG